jgi:hypothetical protein
LYTLSFFSNKRPKLFTLIAEVNDGVAVSSSSSSPFLKRRFSLWVDTGLEDATDDLFIFLEDVGGDEYVEGTFLEVLTDP